MARESGGHQIELEPAPAIPSIGSEKFELATNLNWSQPGKPNCAATKQFSASEPKAHLRKRVGQFRAWLRSRPESTIVAFGHSTFWKYFLDAQDRLKNCEVTTVYV